MGVGIDIQNDDHKVKFGLVHHANQNITFRLSVIRILLIYKFNHRFKQTLMNLFKLNPQSFIE